MTVYEEAAEKAWAAILAKIKDLVKNKGVKPAEISRMLGHKGRSAVSNWLAGASTAVHCEFSEMLRYMDLLDLDPKDFLPSKVPAIKRIGPNAPLEKIEGENLPPIPVLGHTGAGNAVELFSQEPEFWLPVLPQYFRTGVIGLVVDGDSMEPTIKKGAFVGVVPYDGSINEGGVYLIDRPPFGRIIKRIKMGTDNNLLLISDNPDYPPIHVSEEGYEKIIVGRVIWIWQAC